MKLVPVPMVVVVFPSYHCGVSLAAQVAVKVTLLAKQISGLLILTPVGANGMAFTFSVTKAREAGKVSQELLLSLQPT